MKDASQMANRSTLLLLALIALMLGHEAMGRRPMAAGPVKPAIIATFDLEKVYNALNEKAAAEVALQKLAEEMQAKIKTSTDALKQLEAELKDHLPGAPKFRELEEKWGLASFESRTAVELDRARLNEERASSMRRIYGNIKVAVEKMAVENNYDVVFVDDSIAELPVTDAEKTEIQIGARRMVYTSPEVDITEELTSRMNAAFGPAPNIPAAPPQQAPAQQPPANKPGP